MSVLSVPLTARLEEAIQNLLRMGIGSNKADIARKAILQLEEEAAIMEVYKSEQELREGKAISGDIRKLAA